MATVKPKGSSFKGFVEVGTSGLVVVYDGSGVQVKSWPLEPILDPDDGSPVPGGRYIIAVAPEMFQKPHQPDESGGGTDGR